MVTHGVGLTEPGIVEEEVSQSWLRLGVDSLRLFVLKLRVPVEVGGWWGRSTWRKPRERETASHGGWPHRHQTPICEIHLLHNWTLRFVPVDIVSVVVVQLQKKIFLLL